MPLPCSLRWREPAAEPCLVSAVQSVPSAIYQRVLQCIKDEHAETSGLMVRERSGVFASAESHASTVHTLRVSHDIVLEVPVFLRIGLHPSS